MSYELKLGIGFTLAVCAVIGIVTLVLKIRYEREVQRRGPAADAPRKPDDTDVIRS